jgi:prepilin-type N-terminal cleavage/methylation domain-containing protein
MRNQSTAHIKPARRLKSSSGLSLIELMVAMAILATGMSAIIGLIITATANNNKAKVDTGGTLVAQMVIEQMLAQPASSALTITDCNATNWAISTDGANSPGNGATLTSAGAIDYTQAYSGVATNYKMQFRSCGTTGGWTTYDVRWNVLSISAKARMVTISARPLNASAATGVAKARMFQLPVTLKTIVVNAN